MSAPRFILIIALSFPVWGHAQSSASMRTWTDQQGRSIQAALVRAEGANVVLQLENGTVSTVSLERFSAVDQAFVKEQVGTPADSSLAVLPAGSTALVWPETIAVPTKDLEITEGEQSAKERRYVYNSGSFQFVSNAPLTGTVMREIARDFELTRSLFRQLPWAWEPRPINGTAIFQANLYETEADYLAAGGTENTSAGSNKDFIFTKFSTLGLKKVGGRYAYDTKLDKEGDLTKMITRLMIGDMRNFLVPWSANGLEELLRRSYRNNSYALARPHNGIKERVSYMAESGYPIDVDRMLLYLHRASNTDTRPTTRELLNNYMDGMLLVFFFGYLDGDGKGTRLHEYYRTVAQDTLAYRRYEDAGRKGPSPITGGRSEMALARTNIVIQDRDDSKLKEEIISKFKSIGMKL